MNILVTAIGSFSADCVIKTLKKSGHTVIGCDIYPSGWHPISKECDAVYQAPFATKEKEYIDFLVEICKKHQVKFLFPLIDLEIDVLNNYRERFKQTGVLLCIQSEECLSIARNKFTLTNLFQNDSLINVPFSVHSSRLSLDFQLPAIAKPVNGRSSEGLEKLLTKEELSRIVDKDNYIVQKLLEGPVYTVDYVRDQYGHEFSIPREELLRTNNGAGTTVRIVSDSHLKKIVSCIGNKIDVVGCVNMEFILHNDKYYLIDINPRFSAGVAFSSFAGYDMITSHLNCFLNKSILKGNEIKEQIIAKRYQEELLWQA